jgi:hypothetical protein
MLALLKGRIVIYVVEMDSCSMIYIPSFMNIDTAIHRILRICFRNLNVCNVGITERLEP